MAVARVCHKHKLCHGPGVTEPRRSRYGAVALLRGTLTDLPERASAVEQRKELHGTLLLQMLLYINYVRKSVLLRSFEHCVNAY